MWMPGSSVTTSTTSRPTWNTPSKTPRAGPSAATWSLRESVWEELKGEKTVSVRYLPSDPDWSVVEGEENTTPEGPPIIAAGVLCTLMGTAFFVFGILGIDNPNGGRKAEGHTPPRHRRRATAGFRLAGCTAGAGGGARAERDPTGPPTCGDRRTPPRPSASLGGLNIALRPAGHRGQFVQSYGWFPLGRGRHGPRGR